MNSTGIQEAPGYQYNAGIAYVAIPSDLDRERYIADCYSNCQVSLWVNDGSFLNRVPVSPEVLSFLEFPLEKNQLGSPVIYVTDELHKQLYIVARLLRRNQLGDIKEHQFKFKRQLDNAIVEISGNVKNGTINLLIDSADETGSLNVNLFSRNDNAKLNVQVQGNIEIVSAGNTVIKQHDRITIETVDQNSDDSARVEQTATEHKFYNKKLTVNDGDEPMVLGNKLNDLFDKLIDSIASITVQKKPVDPDIQIKIRALKGDVKKILSEEGFLNK